MSKIERYLFVAKNGKIHTLMEYDVEKDKYKIYINPYITFEESTAFESCFIQKGIYNLDDRWSLNYIQQRVIPYNRHGIGGSLKALGIDHYYEYPFLKAANGRCTDDDHEMQEFNGNYEDFKRVCYEQCIKDKKKK